MGTYLPGAATLGWVVWSGDGIPHSWGIPSDFYPPHVDVGPCVPRLHATLHLHISPPLSASLHISVSPPLLPVWMNVASLNLWLSDFHTAQSSDNSGWYLFCSVVVIFALGGQGGELCLLTPPS